MSVIFQKGDFWPFQFGYHNAIFQDLPSQLYAIRTMHLLMNIQLLTGWEVF